MSSMISFLQHLYSDYGRFTEAEFSLKIYRKNYKKNEIITGYHARETRIHFLLSGIAEFDLVEGDRERIVDFFFPGSFFCAMTSFITGVPSEVHIVAV
jgi:CRP-like cAMP-binding protein